MAAASDKKAAAKSEPKAETVLVPFAYATAKNGEVVQLVKGDVVVADRFTAASIEHLRSISFIGSQD